MSSTPPQGAPASDAPGPPNDPWNLRRMLDTLPPPLQQLFTQPLTDIMSTCHSVCSDSIESANAVTRDLEHLLQRLVAAVDTELQSNSSSDIRTSSESWHLLGRLGDGINRHFQIRPRIMFVSEDADMQSAAAAARGIKACFTRLIELLSCDEDRAGNVAAFNIYLMDTDGDAETSMRFAFLDIISRRVVAVKRPSQRWHVTIDEEEVRHNCMRDDAVSSGFDDVPTPLRKDNFEDLECPICGEPLFVKEGDGSMVLLARQLKCPTVVGVTDRTPTGHRFPHVTCDSCAQRQFIEHKQTSCPHCRHNFQEHLCVDIAAALQHQVHEDGRVLWTAAPQRRLAALNMLMQLPVETPLGDSISPAVLQSCFDAEASIAAAVLRCRRLSDAIEAVPAAEARKWFAKLIFRLQRSDTDYERENFAFAVQEIFGNVGLEGVAVLFDCWIERGLVSLIVALVMALNVAVRDATRFNIASAILPLVQMEEGRAALIDAGACAALVEALKVAEDLYTRDLIAFSISSISEIENGRVALIDAGACAVLVEALKVAEINHTRCSISLAIGYLCWIEEGRVALIDAGACAALVEVLKVAETDATRSAIAFSISSISEIENGRVALIDAGACAALVEALKVAEIDDTRADVASAISYLCRIEKGRVALIAALVEALKVAERDVMRLNIAYAISHLARNTYAISSISEIEEGRVALIDAGACAALVEALKIAETVNIRALLASAIAALSEIEEGRVVLIADLVEALKVAERDVMRLNIAYAISLLAWNEDGRVALIDAGACAALVEALKDAERHDARERIVYCISHLAGIEEGRVALFASGACASLVEALKVAEDNETTNSISFAIANLSEIETGCPALIAAGACAALVEALKKFDTVLTGHLTAEEGDTKRNIFSAISHLSMVKEGRVSLITACAALVEALKVAETDDSRCSIAFQISLLAEIENGRVALIAAGACAALVEALKVAEDLYTRDLIASLILNQFP